MSGRKMAGRDQRLVRSLDSLAEISAKRLKNWAISGQLALQHHGAATTITELEVVANAVPAGAVEATRIGEDGHRWTPEGGLPIVWRVREDHYAGLWAACLAEASGTPPVVSSAALVALLLMSRAHRPELLALLIADHMNFDEARTFVGGHLGPYALDDLEGVMQDAEWAVMRRRYASAERSGGPESGQPTALDGEFGDEGAGTLH